MHSMQKKHKIKIIWDFYTSNISQYIYTIKYPILAKKTKRYYLGHDVAMTSPAVVACHRGCVLPLAVVHMTSHTL